MTKKIPRRDFLNGMAMTVGGALVASIAPSASVDAQDRTALAGPEQAPSYYPPSRTGMRGSHAGSFEAAHRVRDEHTWRDVAVDTGETYDLVVVGGGISGLSSAYFFRDAVGPDARVLVLDNHDDFGGHAKRNEFQHDGRLLLLNGGTLNIESPKQYSAQAMALLKAIGIDIERFETEIAPDHDVYTKLGLKNGVWFNAERCSVDRLLVGTPGGRGDDGRGPAAWTAFLADAPIPPQAKQDIVRLYSQTQPDYLPGLTSDEKKQKLLYISYQDYLLQFAKVHPDAAWFFQTRSTGLFLMQTDALPAYYAWNMNYPGFQGLALDPTPPEVLIHEPGGSHGRENQARANAGGRSIHFPDGNATIARLLVRALNPEAVPGHSQEDIVTARVNYALLDRPQNRTNVRLNSIVVNVRHAGAAAQSTGVEVTYVRGGVTFKVRAANVILACWNSVIPHICPELPEEQKKALAYGIKAPIVYTNVLVRNWTSFANLGVSNISAPGGYHAAVDLPEPVSIGAYKASVRPEEPTVLHLVRTPCAPGKPRQEQHRLGRAELLATPFEEFERQIRGQLGRMLSGGGFDPARDIAGITVNRWPHGYTYNYNTLADPVEWALSSPDDRAFVVGRKSWGRISIANADAGGSSHTDAAIEMAFRAVDEVIQSRSQRYLSGLKRS